MILNICLSFMFLAVVVLLSLSMQHFVHLYFDQNTKMCHTTDDEGAQKIARKPDILPGCGMVAARHNVDACRCRLSATPSRLPHRWMYAYEFHRRTMHNVV